MIYKVTTKYETSYSKEVTKDTYVEAEYKTDALQQVLGAFTDYYCHITKVEVKPLSQLDKERKTWRRLALYAGAIILAIILGTLLGVIS